MNAPTLRGHQPVATLETQTAPCDGGPAGRATRVVGRMLRRAPVSVGLVVLLWGFSLASGNLRGATPGWRDAVGIGLPALVEGRWWTLLSSVLWCGGPGGYAVATLSVVFLMAPAENRIGSRRTLLVAGVAQVLGVMAGLGLVALGARVGDPWFAQMMGTVAAGPSPVVFAVALAASARFGVLTRRRVRLLLVVTLVMVALYSGTLQDLLRLTVGLSGLAAGALINRSARTATALRASMPESRLLVALVVAASAAGPLIAALSGTAVGPLSVVRFLLMSPAPDAATVQATCATSGVLEDCLGLQARLRLSGLGPAIMSVMPVLCLLVLADGLRRGRRFAWWGALVLNVALGGLAAVQAVLTGSSLVERHLVFGGASDTQHTTGVAAAVIQPFLIAALLLATRRRFTVIAPRGSARRWTLVVTGAFVFGAAVYLVGGVILRSGFFPTPDLWQVVADLPTRYLPPGYLGEVEVGYLPVRPATTVLYEWTGIMFWAVALAATMALSRRTRAPRGDAAAARALLVTGGGSSLSWMITWRGHSYWFAEHGRAAVAYRVIGGVAIATGEPFGHRGDRAAAARAFVQYCAEHAWTPCFYSIGAVTRDALGALDWASTQVAEETVVPLAGLAFTGRRWQDVRTALNNARRAGVVAEFVRFNDAPAGVTRQIRALSEEWVAGRDLPEMGFTLGGLAELADEEVRCVIARDADGTVHGVTSFLPVYESGAVVGWTLDFMRRRHDALRGVNEFLIASAALRFEEEGAAFVSLSGAPLTRLDRGEETGAVDRLLDLSSRALEPAYGFRSLLAFKAKFQPEYRPLYISYPDVTALPAIGAALTRAYLPDLDTPRAATLIRRLCRRGS